MEKIKFAKVKKKELLQALYTYQIVSHSMQDSNIIIKEFNELSFEQRKEIVRKYTEMEETLKSQIVTKDEDLYLTCSLVNLHIIASKYNIDPSTVCMCISPICKYNEKIIVV